MQIAIAIFVAVVRITVTVVGFAIRAFIGLISLMSALLSCSALERGDLSIALMMMSGAVVLLIFAVFPPKYNARHSSV